MSMILKVSYMKSNNISYTYQSCFEYIKNTIIIKLHLWNTKNDTFSRVIREYNFKIDNVKTYITAASNEQGKCPQLYSLYLPVCIV
jgi:hypothetical protein